MSAMKANREGLKRLFGVSPLLPVSVVARGGGVCPKRLYNLRDAGSIRFVVVEGFALVDVASVLRHYGGSS